MNPRYFKSSVSGLVWKFTDDAAFVRSGGGEWMESTMTLGGMNQFADEITAEEGEP